MIQRIQSVYLFLAGIIPALTFFAPVASLETDSGMLSMNALGYEAVNYPVAAGLLPWGMTLMAILLIGINLWNIFCYEDRKKQIRLTNWTVALTLLFYVAAIVHVILLAKDVEASIKPAPVFFAPLIALCFTLLARKAIRHDEALVRAADRIR